MNTKILLGLPKTKQVGFEHAKKRCEHWLAEPPPLLWVWACSWIQRFFIESAPLGRFSHRNAISVCLSVCVCVVLRHRVQFFLRPLIGPQVTNTTVEIVDKQGFGLSGKVVPATAWIYFLLLYTSSVGHYQMEVI